MIKHVGRRSRQNENAVIVIDSLAQKLKRIHELNLVLRLPCFEWQFQSHRRS